MATVKAEVTPSRVNLERGTMCASLTSKMDKLGCSRFTGTMDDSQSEHSSDDDSSDERVFVRTRRTYRCRLQMDELVKIQSFEPHFDFASVPYNVICRFIQLLPKSSLTKVFFLNKFVYTKCLTIRGIRVILMRVGETVPPGITASAEDGLVLTVYCNKLSYFHEFKARYSKFLPHFDIDTLHVSWYEETEDRLRTAEVFPNNCRTLIGTHATDVVKMDYLIDKHAHPNLEKLELIFYCSRPKMILRMCRYAIERLPHVNQFQFTLIIVWDDYKGLVLPTTNPRPTANVQFRFYPLGKSHEYRDCRWADLERTLNWSLDVYTV